VIFCDVASDKLPTDFFKKRVYVVTITNIMIQNFDVISGKFNRI
jgi:hypothetical protein